MKNILSFSAMLVMCACVLAAPDLRAQRKADTEERYEFRRETADKIYEFTAPANGSNARLTLKSELRDGSIKWTLHDASGAVRLSGKGWGRGKYLGDTGDVMPGAGGVWKLKIELVDASGDFSATWKAR